MTPNQKLCQIIIYSLLGAILMGILLYEIITLPTVQLSGPLLFIKRLFLIVLGLLVVKQRIEMWRRMEANALLNAETQ